MKIDYDLDGYRYLTDDTGDIAEDTQFLLTAQNRKYFEENKIVILLERE